MTRGRPIWLLYTPSRYRSQLSCLQHHPQLLALSLWVLARVSKLYETLWVNYMCAYNSPELSASLNCVPPYIHEPTVCVCVRARSCMSLKGSVHSRHWWTLGKMLSISYAHVHTHSTLTSTCPPTPIPISGQRCCLRMRPGERAVVQRVKNVLGGKLQVLSHLQMEMTQIRERKWGGGEEMAWSVSRRQEEEKPRQPREEQREQRRLAQTAQTPHLYGWCTQSTVPSGDREAGQNG